MDVPDAASKLKEELAAFAVAAPLPPTCVFCGATHVTYDGWRHRSLSLLVAGHPVYLDSIPCRRVRCAGCDHGWTLRPPGVLPRRHFQACVVAQATSQYLFDAAAAQEHVATAHGCSRRTLGRWLGYVGQVAAPADLERHVCAASEAPVLVQTPAVAALARKAASPPARARLTLAALCLVLFEALGAAWHLPPPGFGAVLQLALAERDRVTTYAAPAIPVLARRPGGPLLAFLGCEHRRPA
ncbi:MAG TPA: hypothetical protein VGQ83_34240 [Polyangia bacterium]|jgi:hypothetical protein